MFKNFLEIPFKPVKSDKIYWKFMGRLITVSNNDSGSNAKAKISFDINNAKKTANTEEGSSAKRPVFSIENGQTDQAGTDEKNLETSGKQALVSKQPVFDIHTDTEQENGDDSVSIASNSLTNAESAPQITVQSKVPDSSATYLESQAITLTRDDLKQSLTLAQDFSSASAQMSESLEEKEVQNSEINSENTESPLDSLMALNQELSKLQQELDANSLSLASNNSESETPNVEQSLTREAYRSSVSETQNEQESIETNESTLAQSQESQVARPQPPRPPKIDGEKVKPIFATPEEEQSKSKQPKVEWNGPQVQRKKEQQSSRVETQSSSRVQNTTSHSRSASRRTNNHQSKKQSGVLGKSFLAMLGFGQKDE